MIQFGHVIVNFEKVLRKQFLVAFFFFFLFSDLDAVRKRGSFYDWVHQ